MDTFLPASFWFCNSPKKIQFDAYNQTLYQHLHEYVCVCVCVCACLCHCLVIFGTLVFVCVHTCNMIKRIRAIFPCEIFNQWCACRQIFCGIFSHSYSVICFLSFQPEISSSSFSSIQTKAHSSSFINLCHCRSIGIEGKEPQWKLYIQTNSSSASDLTISIFCL